MMKTMMLAVLIVGGCLMLPQSARADSACTTNLLDCYTAAAKVDDFWRRWAAGIDCEIDYAGCVRDMLLSE